MTPSGKPLVYMDGDLVPWENANLHASTHGFLYGTGVFEGVRAYWNASDATLAIFELDAHSVRLARNARILGFPNCPDEKTIAKATLDVLEANAFKSDVYIRPIIYIGEGGIGIAPSTQQTRFLIMATPFGKYFGKEVLSVKMSSWTRISGSTIPPNAKVNGAYVNSYLATREARDGGFDEALMLNRRGYIAEGPGENLFVVKKDTLITPPESEDILDGVTRHHVIDLAADLGLNVIERPIGRSEIYAVDEAFFCGTGVEITPIGRVDHVTLGDGKAGPTTLRVKELFQASVHGQVPKYHSKLTIVGSNSRRIPV